MLKAVYLLNAQDCMKKYIEANRLINLVNKGQFQCEVHISPNAPFAREFKGLTDFSLEGKKVAKVCVMSVEEYEDFTQTALASVKKGVLELEKQKNLETPADKKSEGIANSFASVNNSLKKGVFTVSLYTLLSEAQKTFHQAIMVILETMRVIEQRAAERAKKVDEKRAEERQFVEKQNVKNEFLKKTILNKVIQNQILEQAILKQALK